MRTRNPTFAQTVYFKPGHPCTESEIVRERYSMYAATFATERDNGEAEGSRG